MLGRMRFDPQPYRLEPQGPRMPACTRRAQGWAWYRRSADLHQHGALGSGQRAARLRIADHDCERARGQVRGEALTRIIELLPGICYAPANLPTLPRGRNASRRHLWPLLTTPGVAYDWPGQFASLC